MDFSILFRKDPSNLDEYPFAQKYFNTFRFRSDCPAHNLIIGRYSVLPYYPELEYDLSQFDSKLINSYSQHKYIADFEYYEDVKDLTFPTWTFETLYLCEHPGPFVVKGKTNSRKHAWNRSMYAADRKTAIEISSKLSEDPLLQSQGILFRQYIPLKTLDVGLNGLPFTNEFRFFFLGEKIIAFGYYWSNMTDKAHLAEMNYDGLEFANKCAKIISQKVPFFVIDIAQKEDNNWILVEVNDAQMSGLSAIDPDLFYSNLKLKVGQWISSSKDLEV